MSLEFVVAIVGTGLLAWVAVEDVRRRKIPVMAGFGMLLLGLVVLLAQSLCAWAGFFAAAIWCTRGGVWRFVLLGGSMVMLWLHGWDALPLVLGVLFVSMLFWMKWFGGGDAQLALGLLGIGHDWLVLGLVFGLTIVVAVVLTMIRRGGVVQGARRLAWVAGHLGEPADAEAIRTPWGIVAAVAGVTYLWLWAVVL